MDLTNKTVERNGFIRINNSMWRYGDLTLQNGYIHTGDSFIEKLLSQRKAYKVCLRGAYVEMITSVKRLRELKQL